MKISGLALKKNIVLTAQNYVRCEKITGGTNICGWNK